MKSEPWQAISTESSPVYELGARKTLTSTSSSMLPSASFMRPYCIVYPLHSQSCFLPCLNILSTIPIASSPETLIIPMAPPAGVASAQIVDDGMSCWLKYSEKNYILSRTVSMRLSIVFLYPVLAFPARLFAMTMHVVTALCPISLANPARAELSISKLVILLP